MVLIRKYVLGHAGVLVALLTTFAERDMITVVMDVNWNLAHVLHITDRSQRTAAVEQGPAGAYAEEAALGVAARLLAFVDVTALIAALAARTHLDNVAATLPISSLVS